MTAPKSGLMAAVLDRERVDSPRLAALAERAARVGGAGSLDLLAFALEGFVSPLRFDITPQAEVRRVPQSREHAGDGFFPAASPPARALKRLLAELPVPGEDTLGALRRLDGLEAERSLVVEPSPAAPIRALSLQALQVHAALDLYQWVLEVPAHDAAEGLLAEAQARMGEEALRLRARRALGALAVACAGRGMGASDEGTDGAGEGAGSPDGLKAQSDELGQGPGTTGAGANADADSSPPAGAALPLSSIALRHLVDLLVDRSAVPDPGERAWRRLGLLVRLLLESTDGVLPRVAVYEEARLEVKERGEIWLSASTITDAYGGPGRDGWARALLAALALALGQSSTLSSERKRAPVAQYMPDEFPAALLQARRGLGFRPNMSQYELWSRWHLRATRKGHSGKAPDRLPCSHTFYNHFRRRGGVATAYRQAARLEGW